MNDLGPHRYVRINKETGQLFQDLMLTSAEADNINCKLAADGSDFRWERFATRREDLAA